MSVARRNAGISSGVVLGVIAAVLLALLVIWLLLGNGIVGGTASEGDVVLSADGGMRSTAWSDAGTGLGHVGSDVTLPALGVGWSDVGSSGLR